VNGSGRVILKVQLQHSRGENEDDYDKYPKLFQFSPPSFMQHTSGFKIF
jgi:hypothetical protein